MIFACLIYLSDQKQRLWLKYCDYSDLTLALSHVSPSDSDVMIDLDMV